MCWPGVATHDASIVEYQGLLIGHLERAADHAGYARVLTWSGHIEASLPEFRRALAEDSTDIDAHLDLARALSWIGDLPGATMEYKRILIDHPAQGDAWLGYATVARWRSGATASDRFLARAEAHGAEKCGGAPRSGRPCVRRWRRRSAADGRASRSASTWPAPTTRSGPGDPSPARRMTVGRTADLDVRAAVARSVRACRVRDAQLRRIGTRLIRADISLLRGYPFQMAAGLGHRAT